MLNFIVKVVIVLVAIRVVDTLLHVEQTRRSN